MAPKTSKASSSEDNKGILSRLFHKHPKLPAPNGPTSAPQTTTVTTQASGTRSAVDQSSSPKPGTAFPDAPPKEDSIRGEANSEFGVDTEVEFDATSVEEEPEENEKEKEKQTKRERNLWEEAWNSPEIREGEKEVLSAKVGDEKDNGSPLKSHKDLVDRVIRQTEDKLVEYKSRGWQIEGRDGEMINVRDTAKSIMVSILSFKDLVDAGLKFDPTGYGASAWAVISFGLKLVQNDKKRMDAIFESSAYLTKLLARYAYMEAHYRQSSADGSDQLETAIIEVYTAVFHYTAEVKSSQQLPPLKRIAASIRALTGQPLEDLKSTVIGKDKEGGEWRDMIENEFRQIEFGTIKDKVDKILDKFDKAVAQISVIEKFVLLAEQHNVLDWLSNIKYSSKHETLRKDIEKWNPESGKWLLQSEKFSDWMSYPPTFLWLFGKSGCGKSYLCSTVIASLDEIRQNDQSKILAYWYFDFRNAAMQSVDNLLCSLLRQLTPGSQRFPEEISKLSDTHRKRDSRPRTKDLVSALDVLIRGLKKDVFLVLDGIDEYPEDAEDTKREDVLKLIETIVGKDYDNLHVLITSKEEPDIRKWFEGLGNGPEELDIEDQISTDLDSFIERKMSTDRNLNDLDDDLKHQIEQRLNEGEERQFLWIASLLEDLRACRGDGDRIRETLHRVPGTMEKKYEDALKNVAEADVDTMRSILTWLLRSIRPLTQQEMAQFVGLKHPNDVTRICTSALATLSKETLTINGRSKDRHILRVVHFSVKQYLESDKFRDSGQQQLARFFVPEDVAHAKLATSCLSYLLGSEEGKRERAARSPLLYSAQYWFRHVKAIKSAVEEPVMKTLNSRINELFQSSSPRFIGWLRIYDPDDGTPSADFTSDQSSSESGSPDNDVEGSDRRSETSDSDAPQTRFASPVYYALKLELLDIAQQLIEGDANINAPGGREGTALQLASYHGYSNIVQQLLGKDADVNAAGGLHGTALYAASSQGHAEIVAILLLADADPNSPEGTYGNALQAASFLGFQEIVEQLVAKADVNATGGLFGNALQAASAAGHREIVTLLLSRRADPNAVGGLLGTALLAASTGDHDQTVEVLRDREAKHYLDDAKYWEDARTKLSEEFRSAMEQYEDFLQERYEIFLQDVQLIWKGLGERQRLLATAIANSQLPSKEILHRAQRRLERWFGYNIPLLFQLDDLQRALPTRKADLADLSHEGFIHKALFWAGIDRILESLMPLTEFFRDYNVAEDRLVVWGKRSRFRHLVTGYRDIRDDLLPDPNLSDVLAIDWAQRKQESTQQKPSGQEREHTSILAFKPRKGLRTAISGRDFDRISGDRIPDDLGLSDLLNLLKEIVQIANHCDHYEQVKLEGGGPVASQFRTRMAVLCLELFSAVMRLANALEVLYRSGSRSPQPVYHTVRLICQARLDRIKGLDSLCQQELQLLGISKRPQPSAPLDQLLQDTISKQVLDFQSQIADQIARVQPTVSDAVQTQISTLMRSETSRLMEQLRSELPGLIRLELEKQLQSGT